MHVQIVKQDTEGSVVKFLFAMDAWQMILKFVPEEELVCQQTFARHVLMDMVDSNATCQFVTTFSRTVLVYALLREVA